ncbi:DNA replication/repair protein RecF [Lactobacillus sp. DCY120]|uniref:DNA replication and repair protein RecF n=1 Tax=Bombilactobacillus apium TaxID=2675299 RepID=A0A850R3Q2_9LACO|nr:DNA replication/repair protein RecF [Bombilactobacillus apium]NVY96601.1 DNA replication/repair protein RecF [Bombilactobacillus apium]
MELQRLKLQNFRNYDQLELEFAPRTNIFIGANAQGKTNLLEAIYVLALVRSHRTNNNQELIRWEQDFARLQAQIKRAQGRLTLELVLSAAGPHAVINHLEQPRLSQYVGQLNVVLFAPEDLNLVKGSPNLRRRFIDMELGQIDPVYLQNSAKYRQVLKQRNSYLKKLRQHQSQDRLYLEVLTDQLAGYGAEVIRARQKFLGQLESLIQPIHQQITAQSEHLSLNYQCGLEETTTSIEQLYQQLLTKLQAQQEHDLRLGTTTVGPHRDDFLFQVNANNLQKFGSQGQQRTAVLSLKLAEIDLFQQVVGDYPLLLLDDVLSELDQERQTQLLKTIEDRIQTFITTTSLDNVNLQAIEQPRIFKIKAGGIV